MICSSAAICSFGCRALLKAASSSSALRYAFAANLDRLGLFCGDRKSAACLQCLLGRFPPAFPFRLSENIAYQPFTDLLRAWLYRPSFPEYFAPPQTGFSLAKFFIDARSVALRARKCSGASGVRFSAAYCDLHRMRLFSLQNRLRSG